MIQYCRKGLPKKVERRGTTTNLKWVVGLMLFLLIVVMLKSL
jgi:hypothetical protein